MGTMGRNGRMGGMGSRKNGLKDFPFQPVQPIPPVQPGDYRLNVPKNAERLFGSLHLVPSDAPVKAF
jgi:hypothetical protein